MQKWKENAKKECSTYKKENGRVMNSHFRHFVIDFLGDFADRFAESGAVCSMRRIIYFQFHANALSVWYSVTLVSKKFFSFLRLISSDIHGNGFSAPGNRISVPICWQRRLVTNRRYPLSWFVFHECIPRSSLSSTAS